MNKRHTIELPTQIPMVNSILSFIAIQTEVTCSAALETRGNRIKPMKGLGMLYRSAVSSMEATTNAKVGTMNEEKRSRSTHGSQQRKR